MKDFEIYSKGMCHMSCCSSLESESEIEERANVENPTGISSRWEIMDQDFSCGTPSRGPCPDNPKTHKHYLLGC